VPAPPCTTSWNFCPVILGEISCPCATIPQRAKARQRIARQVNFTVSHETVIVFNPRAISMAVGNFLRRQRWRFRPLKRLILPVRSMKRAAVEFIGPFFGRTILRLEPSSLMYANTHTEISVREIHSAEVVRLPSHPFRTPTSSGELRVGPAFVFEIPNVNFWCCYGGAVVTVDNAVLADLSPEVWGPANHPIFSRWHLPKSRLLNGRIAIAVTPEARGNYYHWLLDLVPRVLLLKHAAQNFSNYDALLLNGSRANYEGEILTALGVPPEKVRYVDSRERFQIASAVIPSMDINVIAPWKVYGLRDLPFSGKQSQYRPLIFRGHAPHFAGSRMKTKSQRSCSTGTSRLSNPKIFPGGNRQTCSPARV